MYKTNTRGREEEETGSVCVHVHAYYNMARGERVKLDIRGAKEPMEGVPGS